MPKHRYDQPPVHRPWEEREAEHHSERTPQPTDAAAEVVERDLADMDAAAKERLAREAAEPDAATAVELEARARAIEKLPATARDMIAATVASAGEGALNDLSIRYGRDNHIFMLASALEQRVRRFFTANGEANNPSYYAGLVHRALTGQLEANEQRVFTEFQFYFTQEVNPLLQELYKALQRVPGNGIRSEKEFWQLLQVGEAQRQRTTSVFGVLKLLGPRLEGIARLDIQAVRPQQRIVVENPLSVDRKAGYWEERLRLQEVYGETTLPRMIALRSSIVVETLRTEMACTPEDEQYEDLRAAYEIVAQWCETHSQAFTDSSAEEPEEFGFLIRRLHFAQGESEDVVDFLNAAEVIKRQNPELFERMAGIAPRYDHGTRGDYELGESDMFGSVFHLGLHRSLELTIRSNSSVSELLHYRIASLTELNRPQPLLQHLNADQIQQLANTYRAQQQQVQEGSNIERTVSTVIAFAQTRFLFEAKLPHMLEAIRSQEWDERREYFAEFFKVARPDKFIKKLAELPNEFIDDPEITQVINQRLFDRAPKRNDYYHGWSPDLIPFVEQRAEGGRGDVARGGTAANYESRVDSVWTLVRAVKEYKIGLEKYGTLDQIKGFLWETASDRDVLTMEFLKDLQSLTKKEVLGVLNAHPGISTKEWQDWYAATSTTSILKAAVASGIIPSRSLGRTIAGTAKQALERFFEEVLPEEIIQSPSRFFTLYKEINNGGDEAMNEQLKAITAKNPDQATRTRNEQLLEQPVGKLALNIQLHGHEAAANLFFDTMRNPNIELLNQCTFEQLEQELNDTQRAELGRHIAIFFKNRHLRLADKLSEGIARPTFDSSDTVTGQPNILQFAEKYCPDSPEYQQIAGQKIYMQFVLFGNQWKISEVERQGNQWVIKPFVRVTRSDDYSRKELGVNSPLEENYSTIEKFNPDTNAWDKVTKEKVPELSEYDIFK